MFKTCITADKDISELNWNYFNKHMFPDPHLLI